MKTNGRYFLAGALLVGGLLASTAVRSQSAELLLLGQIAQASGLSLGLRDRGLGRDDWQPLPPPEPTEVPKNVADLKAGEKGFVDCAAIYAHGMDSLSVETWSKAWPEPYERAQMLVSNLGEGVWVADARACEGLQAGLRKWSGHAGPGVPMDHVLLPHPPKED